jgi:hypothetical protein
VIVVVGRTVVVRGRMKRSLSVRIELVEMPAQRREGPSTGSGRTVMVVVGRTVMVRGRMKRSLSVRIELVEMPAQRRKGLRQAQAER